jgi:hypothetical protein
VPHFLQVPRERVHAEAVIELDEALGPVGVVHVAGSDALVGETRRVALDRPRDPLASRRVHEVRAAGVGA